MRRKIRYISETSRRKDDARTWALDAERQIDREAPKEANTHLKPSRSTPLRRREWRDDGLADRSLRLHIDRNIGQWSGA
ncbi:MAG: hypothetical protein ACREH6_08825 [Geminicoccaceae bacterium]